MYTGNVTENGTAGMTVMTMTATDYDDPMEGTNAKLTYSIEQNQVNENGELIFAIDEETGVISTAVCCLDRETNPEYTIKVRGPQFEPPNSQLHLTNSERHFHIERNRCQHYRKCFRIASSVEIFPPHSSR